MTSLCLNLINLSARYQGGVEIDAQLDAAVEAGARWVGIEAGSIKRFLASGASLEQLRHLLDERELRCWELMYLECDPRKPDGTLAYAHRLASWVEALEARYVLTSTPVVSDAAVELLARCCDEMAQVGGALAYEFFPWSPVDTLSAAAQLLERVDRPNCGVLLDVWHFFHGPGTWEELNTIPLDALAYVQFTDTKPVAPEHYEEEAQTARRFPGDGCLDLERFAKVLKARGFDGVVSIEVLSPETRALGPREFARRCMESTAPYWA